MLIRTTLVVRRDRDPRWSLARWRWFEGNELFIEVTVEADCIWIPDSQEFKALGPKVVSHDGPDELELSWEDLSEPELRRAMRALQAEMGRALPFGLEVAA